VVEEAGVPGENHRPWYKQKTTKIYKRFRFGDFKSIFSNQNYTEENLNSNLTP
jgi:hypothetical protein